MKARSLDNMWCHRCVVTRGPHWRVHDWAHDWTHDRPWAFRPASLREVLLTATMRCGITPPIWDSQVAFAERVAFYQFCWTLLDRSRG